MDINPEECYILCECEGSGWFCGRQWRRGKLYFNCHFTVAFHPNNDDKRHYYFLAGWSAEITRRLCELQSFTYTVRWGFYDTPSPIALTQTQHQVQNSCPGERSINNIIFENSCILKCVVS